MNFTSFRNFRDLGGLKLKSGGFTKHGAFARSDLPRSMTNEERQYLLDTGYRTIIDLRTPDESISLRHALDSDRDFSYSNLKLDNWLRDLFYTPEESAMYYHMLLRFTGNVNAVLTKAAEAEGGVIINCHAGKDRTGTISALLLMTAGVEESEIIDDYHKTKESFWPGVPEEKLKGVRLVPYAENMKIFLEEFKRRYGDIEGYYKYAGIGRDVFEKIRSKFV